MVTMAVSMEGMINELACRMLPRVSRMLWKVFASMMSINPFEGDVVRTL